ncbi:MAG TPA: arsinothricin resistance N-acetyltransferase ArsN1 family A [Thermomicrobiales bacterium]|nr:arsinothricin resistance N-acetyltransferase ArsN1 family A [Thermomicrobiales bacterium]
MNWREGGAMGQQVAAERVTIRAARLDDAAAIAEIYNQGILGRQATFETRLRTADDMIETLRAGEGRFPYLVAEVDGVVTGWASVSSYRSRECYAGIGEFSIYVHEDWRKAGIGRLLLPRLIEAAEAAGFWKLLSRVFPENSGSLRLAEAFGFREVGTYEKHAQLDGVWRDVVIIERMIPANQP